MKPSCFFRLVTALTTPVLLTAAAFGADAQPTTAPAEDTAATTQPAAAAAPAAPPPLPLITGFLDLPISTAYYKRGFLLENKGVVWQPMVDVSLNAYHGDGFLTDVSLDVGTRESIHSKDTGAQRSPRAWVEADLWFGLHTTFFHRLKLDSTWVDIASPNDFFDTIQEGDWQLTFLDDGIFGPFSFHPTVIFVKEIEHSAVAGPCGNYLEFGIEPAFPLIQSKAFPVRLSFPTRVGMSVRNYYKLPTPFGTTPDETYGFAQAGITAAMPLTFIPHEAGTVILSAGVDFLFLDHNLTLVNHGNGDAVIGRFDITWLF